MPVVRRTSSSAAEFAAPHDTTTISASKRSLAPFTSASTPTTTVPAAFVSSFSARGVAQQGDVRPLERGTHRDHLGVGLGVQQAGKAVAGLAADAPAVGHVRLVEHYRGGGRERVIAGGGKIVGELLDARLVDTGGAG